MKATPNVPALTFLALAVAVLAAPARTSARPAPPAVTPDARDDPRRVVRRDGRFVHDVGRLQLQITNVGQTGNTENPTLTSVPSAEWPAGSGHDYLFAAGLWVGALDASGIPHVTTALYDTEFSPEIIPTNPCAPLPLDRIADVRPSYEGTPNGNRVISSTLDPDDDGDGFIDEDFLNGLDDDLDGACDEDFAAIGQQMMSTEYFDDIPTIRQIEPEHAPLGIRVRQTSYAWATPGQNDFVGMDYRITNRSGRTLRSVMVAIFADPDIGSRALPDVYYTDDQTGLFDRDVEYIGPSGEVVRRRIQMAYAWDNPDDPNNVQNNQGGDAPGYFGCMFLNHTTDPTGLTAPRKVGITSFKFFSGQGTPYAAGGDPENDAQRFELMTNPQFDPAVTGPIQSSRPLDYRFIMATGPFRSLLPDSSLTISVGWVLGLGLGAAPGGQPLGINEAAPGSLVANAVSVQQIFDGLYTDLDGRITTGTCGKERCLRAGEGSSQVYRIEDRESSPCVVRFHSDLPDTGIFLSIPEWDPEVSCENQQGGRYVCVDQEAPLITHCASADTMDIRVTGPECVYVDADCNVYTGQGGREHLVHWVASSPLPSPIYPGVDGRSEPSVFRDVYATAGDSARISAWFFPGDRKVTLKWNNFGELVRDAQRGNLKEFVGYRIYKASGWDRPFGTNAPARQLWSLLGEWRMSPGGTGARPLSELIDPSAPVVRTSEVTVSWDPVLRRPSSTEFHTELDTLFAVGRYSYVDRNLLNGFPYFYSVVPVSVVPDAGSGGDLVLYGNPNATNAQVVYPRADAQKDQKRVYVVPNPYRARAEWDLVPREDDPSGTRITFRNLPATRGVIHIFSLAGDLIRDIPFDGTAPPDLQYGRDPVVSGAGQASWNLISRNGQKIVSGIYLFSVDSPLGRDVGRFVIIR